MRKAGIEACAAPLPYRQARDRLKQAAGGARQLATCFRIDMAQSVIAAELEAGTRNPSACAGPIRSVADRICPSLIAPLMARHTELHPDIVAFVSHWLEQHGVDTERNVRALALDVQTTIEMFMDDVIDRDDAP